MSTPARISAAGFDPERIRRDFPILQQEVNGHPLVYLDNAATTQKPEQVIDAISHYYRHDNANVHRGAHTLSDRSTLAFEQARETTARYINSPKSSQVIWVRGATEAINVVANSWGRSQLKPGDRILVSWLEHHSNIVPWQLIAAATGAEVVPVPVSGAGEIDLAALAELLDERVKLVAINHVSNALGTINPVTEITRMAHAAGARVMIDGAQAVAHLPVDVAAIGCDFYAFSGHKLFGPTGIGVLWGKEDVLEAMPPFLGGGEMIDTVSFSGSTWNTLPFKFEAGTPDIAGAIGLAAAIDYISGIDMAAAAAHELDLLQQSIELGAGIEGLKRIGSPAQSVGIYSFMIDGVHPSDLGMLLDQQGIAVRTGHHCTQPLMSHYGLPGTVRASYSLYNTAADVEQLFAGIRKAKRLFG
ncbi:cysteine desulfurase CsdA [Kineobactrum sediminis]|uniref:Cysteine desulfurase n=1 Tax=Kineobactrum sediminis TaxID=1905677 RepID=A0A2N5Y1T6_9GAMM|nr:SufS family cysteine desulfurase [Kineobactrum sediminis]PLW82339.1 cysteine desulfurase CsdA [Kineobactrum sediminis]